MDTIPARTARTASTETPTQVIELVEYPARHSLDDYSVGLLRGRRPSYDPAALHSARQQIEHRLGYRGVL